MAPCVGAVCGRGGAGRAVRSGAVRARARAVGGVAHGRGARGNVAGAGERLRQSVHAKKSRGGKPARGCTNAARWSGRGKQSCRSSDRGVAAAAVWLAVGARHDTLPGHHCDVVGEDTAAGVVRPQAALADSAEGGLLLGWPRGQRSSRCRARGKGTRRGGEAARQRGGRVSWRYAASIVCPQPRVPAAHAPAYVV